ncbi:MULTISPECIES: S1 family peptidase [unclassified Streptosporangium]|uniref:S1 family peptidase n=1 Tax=unclassified Streptosporangium TaxID=2632669 RepID=UPI002E2CC103|nr:MULTISPECIES: S1 family peptidase [unclassified Streptosporangium]
MPRRHAAITGCVLAITTLTATAVPTGDRPLTADVTAAAVKPPPGMLMALQRDLHLTAKQAQARLLNETRQAEVETQLRRRLGDRFGGSWLVGTIAETLMVATTNPADLHQIAAEGARGKVVTRSLPQLQALRAQTDEALAAHPLAGGNVRYVDVRANQVVVLSDKPTATRAALKTAGLQPTAVRVVSSPERPLPLSDLVGGEAYYVGATTRCSVGFPVVRGLQNGFVSAGHCGTAGMTTTAGADRVAQGIFQASIFPLHDFAWIAVNKDWTPRPVVNSGSGATVNVAGSRVAIEGASVCRSGSATGWHCGAIRQRNASVVYSQGTVSELTRTTVCAEPGDSGGSFIAIDQAQGVTSGGFGDCGAGGVTYFQPVNEILTTYGLSLVTIHGNPPPPSTGTCTGYPHTAEGTLPVGRTDYRLVDYQSTADGVHFACLAGVVGTDFDLYLQKQDGQNWVTVAAAEGPTPSEKIDYTGTPGHYRYRVVASSRSGAYLLGYKVP